MRRLIHLLYAGTGGMASVALSLAGAEPDPDVEHRFGFYGDVAPLDAHRNACERAGFDFAAFRKRPGVPDPLALGRLLRWLIVQAPDTVLVHVPGTLDAALALRRLRPGTRLVAVEHHPNALKRRREWAQSRRLAARCDAVVYLTDTYRDEVAARLDTRFRPRRTAVIPNGVDVGRFAPSGEGRHDRTRPVRLGMCCRLSPQKDLETLVHAFAALDEPGAILSIAGEGPLLEPLLILCRALGVNDRVEFPGHLDESGLVDFLRGLDVYVQATRNETMSTAVMQALACGLPVVASDVSGMESLVPATVGSRVSVGDVQALAAALDRLVRLPERRRELGVAARRFAVAHLSDERAARAYRDLIDSLDRVAPA